jgi:hypothetical protein
MFSVVIYIILCLTESSIEINSFLSCCLRRDRFSVHYLLLDVEEGTPRATNAKMGPTKHIQGKIAADSRSTYRRIE